MRTSNLVSWFVHSIGESTDLYKIGAFENTPKSISEFTLPCCGQVSQTDPDDQGGKKKIGHF